MQQVTEGVYHISNMGSNFYIIQGKNSIPGENSDEEGLVLIDTGTTSAAEAIAKAENQLGAKVKHVLLTHADLDHVGGLTGLLKKRDDLTLYASQDSAKHMAVPESPPHLPLPLKLIMGGFVRMMQDSVQTDVIIKAGEELALSGGIGVYATPGHTPDHHSFFWQPGRVLFIGDVLFNTPRLMLSPGVITWNMDAVRESLRNMLALNPAYICVGHGEPIEVAPVADKLHALAG